MTRYTLLLAVLVAACAAPQPVWHKPGATQADVDQTIAQCDYESTAATHADPSLRGGFAQAMDQEIRRVSLERKCMAAKGYRQIDFKPAR